MNDYISRQALLRDIEKYHLSDGKFQHWVEVQPSVEAEPVRQWIPCSEQLPEEDTDVLITDEDGDIDIAHYEYNSWSEDPIVEWWNYEYQTYAVAWMPLPEPYKGGQDD